MLLVSDLTNIRAPHFCQVFLNRGNFRVAPDWGATSSSAPEARGSATAKVATMMLDLLLEGCWLATAFPNSLSRLPRPITFHE